jgi:hypothetical protein
MYQRAMEMILLPGDEQSYTSRRPREERHNCQPQEHFLHHRP